MEQKIITAQQQYRQLDAWMGRHRVFLVCGGSLRHFTRLREHLEALEGRGAEIVRFSDFTPNPRYESVVEGVRRFREAGCTAIMAVGGGSAMDVAKCVKLFSGMEEGTNDLEQTPLPNQIPFLAMPTTAGTGAEATSFAVIYYQGVKQSVAGEGCLPDTVLLDPSALDSLPLYQRKATMLDALCHGIESYWSVRSTPESKAYSREALRLLGEYRAGYLENTPEGNQGMLLAANWAGKAINLTQTTAGHAMCYQITSLFGCAHGHAAALCVRKLLPWMVSHTDRCVDPRGEAYLRETLEELGRALGCAGAGEAGEALEALFRELGLEVPAATAEQFALLRSSVNQDRLKNHPVAMDGETIDKLYHEILREAT